ncbi:hypothetical protein B566_EDAN014342 [Ephemera danica]|nr:hypothetical protein B566_EDAN014342 [Ephemera danica]
MLLLYHSRVLNFTTKMSCQGGGLCFILLCCFLAASANGPTPAVPLVNSDKYFIEERQENEHTTVMELTVRNVEPADYRTYSCGSTNRLGGLNCFS